jgi:hypothetical protein
MSDLISSKRHSINPFEWKPPAPLARYYTPSFNKSPKEVIRDTEERCAKAPVDIDGVVYKEGQTFQTKAPC